MTAAPPSPVAATDSLAEVAEVAAAALAVVRCLDGQDAPPDHRRP
jgi:hypothetical protein